MTWARSAGILAGLAAALWLAECGAAEEPSPVKTEVPQLVPIVPASVPATNLTGETGPALFLPDPDLALPSAGDVALDDADSLLLPDDALGGRFGMARGMGSLSPRASYGALWYPVQPVQGQNAYFGFVQQSLGLTMPIWRDGFDGVALTAHVRNGIYQTDAILPQSGLPFPSTLWNIGIGANGTHRFDNGWIGSLAVQVGSASDIPFANLQVINVGFSSALLIPWRESFSWNLSLSYSPTAELTFPIPGLSLTYQPSPYFRVNIGLPFALMWRPTEDLTIEASYMLLTTVRAKVSYRLLERVRMYAEYSSSNEGYYLADYPGTRNRILYHDSRVTGGMQIRLTKWATFDVSGGYGFDRFFGEGSQIGAHGGNNLSIAPGPFGAAALQIRW
jgi:hypothetical protein